MFASLTELSMDESDLSEKNILIILNQIICEFDKLLFESNFSRVEKIKVAGADLKYGSNIIIEIIYSLY